MAAVGLLEKKLSSARPVVNETGAIDSYFFDPSYFGPQRIYNCRFDFNLKMHFSAARAGCVTEI
jgi:hypothetical protein